MFLAIEVGGTKLQLGVGTGNGGPLADLRRATVEPAAGATGILEQIREIGACLIREHGIQAAGIGFGGPIDPLRGMVITSHQIDGWDQFPLVSWTKSEFGIPVRMGNDSDMAGLGEARFGAGRGSSVVMYSNVGSGIGGALVIDGQSFVGGSGGAMEIGHLRPGPSATSNQDSVEAIASGWVMAEIARDRMKTHADKEAEAIADLTARCQGDPGQLNTKILADAMAAGNPLAMDIFQQGIRVYGWALAQTITLIGPNTVVIGGGVALVRESLFLDPLRQEIDRYVFPPRKDTYQIKAAELGEEVVLHGALALAAQASL